MLPEHISHCGRFPGMKRWWLVIRAKPVSLRTAPAPSQSVAVWTNPTHGDAAYYHPWTYACALVSGL